jgi:hypothetical protein
MSQLNISTLANLAGSETTPIADVINGSARAWVNFNGQGTVAIRASYNISSITDNGTGNYTLNFTTALPDVNYSATFGGRYTSAGVALLVCETTATIRTTSSLQIRTANAPQAIPVDSSEVSVSVFR